MIRKGGKKAPTRSRKRRGVTGSVPRGGLVVLLEVLALLALQKAGLLPDAGNSSVVVVQQQGK